MDPDEIAREFVESRRSGRLADNEYIAFRRSSARAFAKLVHRRSYRLGPETIRSVLALCPSSYFVDQTAADDDPAEALIALNPSDRLSNIILGLIDGGPMTKAKFETPVPGADVGIRTEIASLADPDGSVPADSFTLSAMDELGLRCDASTFTGYLEFMEDCRGLRMMLMEAGLPHPTMGDVHEFLLHVYAESRRHGSCAVR